VLAEIGQLVVNHHKNPKNIQVRRSSNSSSKSSRVLAALVIRTVECLYSNGRYCNHSSERMRKRGELTLTHNFLLCLQRGRELINITTRVVVLLTEVGQI